MRNQRVMQFVKRIISLPILFLIGCSNPSGPSESLYVNVYCNLPDVNNDGVYELNLNNDTWQTIHMIDIEVKDDYGPVSYANVNFHSNLYWSLNDTIGYFIHRDLSDNVQYVTYDTSYVTGGSLHDLVPTSNYGSMTGSDGMTRNAIAPVQSMANETLVLTIDVWGRSQQVIETIKIKLEE